MKPERPRDGYLEVDGLRSDFRFLRRHKQARGIVWIETATGEYWELASALVWDKKRKKLP